MPQNQFIFHIRSTRIICANTTNCPRFLWGTLKEKYYEINPESIKSLKQEIVAVVHEMGDQTIKMSLKILVNRMRHSGEFLEKKTEMKFHMSLAKVLC